MRLLRRVGAVRGRYFLRPTEGNAAMKFSVGHIGHCGGSARGVRLTLRLCCGVCHVGDAGLACDALSVAALCVRCALVLAVLAGRFVLSARFAMRSRRGDSLDARRALRFCCGVVCRRHCARHYHSVAALCVRCASAVADLARSLPSVHARPSVSGGAVCRRSCLTSRFCCGVLPSVHA